MELRIEQHSANIYPAGGIFVKGPSPLQWIREMQYLGLHPGPVQTYPLPAAEGGTWGCLLICPELPADTGRNTLAFLVHQRLYVPGHSILYPALTASELDRLLGFDRHVLHPETGLVRLGEALSWEELLSFPEPANVPVTAPAGPVFIPSHVRSFQVQPLPAEEALSFMDEQLFPQNEKLEDKPLSPVEKGRLSFLRKLFRKKEAQGNKHTGKDTDQGGTGQSEPTGLFRRLRSLAGIFSDKGRRWADGLQDDYEELERRNRKEIEKLLDMFRNNPEEALKYAIPIDGEGTGRGGDKARMQISRRWTDFSLAELFRSNATQGGNGSSIISDEHMDQLQQQYKTAAEDFIHRGEYQKAAFIYLKLLKNYWLAAQTLKNGGYYQEAAGVYLKFLNNKALAAECYELGKMYGQAIELYTDLNEHEKAGDLYRILGRKAEANALYGKVLEDRLQHKQYLKAAELLRLKMEDDGRAQQVLKDGWLNAHNGARQCLLEFYLHIPDTRVLMAEIENTYAGELNGQNTEAFLQVIKTPYAKHPELQERLRDMAYEIIEKQVPQKPYLIEELKFFNSGDRMLQRDTQRFRTQQRI